MFAVPCLPITHDARLDIDGGHTGLGLRAIGLVFGAAKLARRTAKAVLRASHMERAYLDYCGSVFAAVGGGVAVGLATAAAIYGPMPHRAPQQAPLELEVSAEPM